MRAARVLRGAARWMSGSGQFRKQARRLPGAPVVTPEMPYRAEASGPADLMVSHDGGPYLCYPTCYRDGSEVREPQEAEAAEAKRRLCAHADHDGEGMHWLELGEKCSWTPAPQATATDIRSRQRHADQEAGH
jgi:hypothetical protein